MRTSPGNLVRVSPLPLVSTLRAWERRLLTAVAAVLMAIVAVTAARAVLHIGGQPSRR